MNPTDYPKRLRRSPARAGLATLLVLSLLAVSTAVLVGLGASSAQAQAALPSTDELGQYLVIGMGDADDIDDAFQMSNSEIGADKTVISPDEEVGFGIGSTFPNLRDVFEERWNLDTDPNSLVDAAPVFQGVDWSGNVALTADNSSFDSSNSLVYADIGIAVSELGSVDEQSRYFADGETSDPVGLDEGGVVEVGDMTALLDELGAWKALITGLEAESEITYDDIENDFKNNEAENGEGGLRTFYEDALDTNGDGLILVDVNADGNDFQLDNLDWVIDGSGAKLVIFRINDGANMLMSNVSITMGTSGIEFTGVVFAHASEEDGSSDTVFNGDNVILSGGAFWDLNDIGSGADHNIVINNGQGCWQFVSQKVDFQNTRWTRCTPNPATGSDGGGSGSGGGSGRLTPGHRACVEQAERTVWFTFVAATVGWCNPFGNYHSILLAS